MFVSRQTLLDLAGITIPTIMDGESMVPLLMGQPAPQWRTRFAAGWDPPKIATVLSAWKMSF